MISVEEARQRLLAPLEAARRRAGRARRGARPRPRRGCGRAPHPAALGRSRRWTAMPCAPPMSRSVPAQLKVVGAVPAGQAYDGTVGAGEAVRIFTGAPVPDGADCHRHPGRHRARRRHRRSCKEGAPVGPLCPPGRARFPRRRGRPQGRPPPHRARCRPRRGDEPALAPGPSPAARRHPADRRRGGDARRSGRAQPDRQLQRHRAGGAGDEPAAACRCSCRSRPTTTARCSASPRARDGADLLVTTGGASVGEHDLVRDALGADRPRARFLDRRDAAGQAADGRALPRHADDRPARQSGLDPGLRRCCS